MSALLLNHRWRAVSAAVLLVIVLSQVTPPLALAHALLLRSSIAQDTVLHSSPSTLRMWFSEQLDTSQSKVVVWNRARTNEVRSVQFVGSNNKEMVVHLAPLNPGAHLVLWTSVSAEDGHVLRGSFLFYVKHRGPGPTVPGSYSGSGQGPPDQATAASIVFHWLELLGAVTFVGAAAISAWVVGRPASDFGGEILSREEYTSRRLARWSLALLFLASLALMVMRGYQLAGNDWSATFTGSTVRDTLSGQYGELWIVRQILVIAGLLLTMIQAPWATARSGHSQAPSMAPKSQLRILALLGAVYLYALAASGHGASAHIGVIASPWPRGDSLLSASIFLDWLHLIADALWLGGQVALAVAILPALLRYAGEGAERGVLDVLDRFSPVAYACVFLYIVTGAFNGKVHIGTWYAFFHSVYGWTLLVKMVLVGAMMLMSAFTVFLLRPTIRRSWQTSTPWTQGRLDGLRRCLSVNPVLGLGVLLATSVMFYYPVPPGLAPAGPSIYRVRVGQLVAALRVRPDRSGPNVVTITLEDAAGRAVTRAHVTLQYTMLDMPMGTGLAPMSMTRPGVYHGTVDLGMGGHWKLQLLVFQPSGLTRGAVRIQVGS
jgi:copper transport protein